MLFSCYNNIKDMIIMPRIRKEKNRNWSKEEKIRAKTLVFNWVQAIISNNNGDQIMENITKEWSWLTLILYIIVAIITSLLFKRSIRHKINNHTIKISNFKVQTKKDRSLF